MNLRGWVVGGVGCAVAVAVAVIASYRIACDDVGREKLKSFRCRGDMTSADGTSRSEVRITAEAPLRKPSVKQARQTTATTDELDDDALLDKVVEDLVVQLSAAIRDRNGNRVLELVRRLKAINYGGLSANGRVRGNASSAKLRILQELAGAGPEAVGAIMDLLSDPEPSVAESAKELLFGKLNDISLNDSARAELVTAAAQELTDTLSIQRLYVEFIKMRPSVGVGAFTEILSSGTDEAKAILPRIMANFTADSTVSTVGDLKEWLQGHGDPEDADRRYGGIKLGGDKEVK